MLLCSKMLTRFWGVRKWDSAIWKATPTMTSPRTWQDPALAAPHPLPPDVQVLAHRLGQELRRDFSDRGRGSQVDSGHCGVTRGSGRHGAGQRVTIDPGHHSP